MTPPTTFEPGTPPPTTFEPGTPPPTTFEPGTPPPTTFEPGTPPPSESLPGFVFEGIKKEAQKNQVLFESSIQDFNSLNDSMNSQIETLRKIKLEISATATTGSP